MSLVWLVMGWDDNPYDKTAIAVIIQGKYRKF